ncbi:hypothetical protein MRY87_13405 [bacterium]|nr:hypothetical protein [bacterium]
MEAESILSIDATHPVLQVVLTQGTGTDIVVQEEFALEASTWWQRWFGSGTLPDNSRENQEEAPPSEQGGGGEVQEEDREGGLFPIKQLLLRLPGKAWDESLIILPPHQAINLSLKLPFSHRSSLNRIAPLEAQDRLPFPVSPFHCHARPVRKLSSELFDVQMDLYPEELISELLRTCKQWKFEPSILTIPAALAETCHGLYPKYVAQSALFVFSGETHYSIAALVEGQSVAYFTLPKTEPSADFVGKSLLNSWIASVEERLEHPLERIYFIGEEMNFQEWNREQLMRPSEVLSYEDILPTSSFLHLEDNFRSGLATLGATAVTKEETATLTPNYRTGRYLFRPELRNLAEGIGPLIKPAILLILVFAALIPLQYFAREQRIASLHDGLRAAVRQAFPDTVIPEGRELFAVRQKLSQSQETLQQLGTGGKISPDKELALLLDRLKKFKSLKLRRVNILREKTVLEGTTASYTDAEQIEGAMKKGRVYCDVSLDTGGGGRMGQQNFDLLLKKECGLS